MCWMYVLFWVWMILIGKPSRRREIFSGDIIQFGSSVTQIQPIIARITISDSNGKLYPTRYLNPEVSCRKSIKLYRSRTRSSFIILHWLRFSYLINNKYYCRRKSSVLFTPADSTEDMTVASDDSEKIDDEQINFNNDINQVLEIFMIKNCNF